MIEVGESLLPILSLPLHVFFLAILPLLYRERASS